MIFDAARVLVIAAHPDDETLGCGGTIARLAESGCTVTIAILGEGITSRHGERGDAPTAALAQLHDDAQAAARHLGAAELIQHDLPDNRFDTVPLLEVVHIVEQVIERVRPEVVLTHHGGDLNIDHAIVHRAVLTATRPVRPVGHALAMGQALVEGQALGGGQALGAGQALGMGQALGDREVHVPPAVMAGVERPQPSGSAGERLRSTRSGAPGAPPGGATVSRTSGHATAVRAVAAFEVLSSTEWSFGQFEPRFRPNVFIDIAETLESKITAMAMYGSEARALPHPRSAEAIRAAALRWGSTAGVPAAEAFELIRLVD